MGLTIETWLLLFVSHCKITVVVVVVAATATAAVPSEIIGVVAAAAAAVVWFFKWRVSKGREVKLLEQRLQSN